MAGCPNPRWALVTRSRRYMTGRANGGNEVASCHAMPELISLGGSRRRRLHLSTASPLRRRRSFQIDSKAPFGPRFLLDYILGIFVLCDVALPYAYHFDLSQMDLKARVAACGSSQRWYRHILGASTQVSVAGRLGGTRHAANVASFRSPSPLVAIDGSECHGSVRPVVKWPITFDAAWYKWMDSGDP
jgi:hypothetical protein